MEQFKRAQVIMLPTKNKKNSLWLDNANYLLSNHFLIKQKPKGKFVHLYITSNDEIKEGDWFLNTKTKAIGQHNGSKILLFKDDKKIIATTDTSLKINSELSNNNSIKFQLPQPSQQFIEKYIESYNKGFQIVDILIQYEEY